MTNVPAPSVIRAVFEFDPFDARFFADPYPAYRVLRREQPVYEIAIAQPRVWPHYWMLSRAADVNAALSDWRTFSSARGTLVDTDISLIPPNIFNMDPPRHDELRAMLARVLTPARVAGLEPRVRECARELVEGFRGKGAFDAATDYAQLIPTITMCELMDLPKRERAQFLHWNLDTLGRRRLHEPGGAARLRRDGRLLAGARRRAAPAARERPDLADPPPPGGRRRALATPRSPASARCCSTPRRTPR